MQDTSRIVQLLITWLSTLDTVYMCLSDDTLKVVGPFYLVSMPGEVKDSTQGVDV